MATCILDMIKKKNKKSHQAKSILGIPRVKPLA